MRLRAMCAAAVFLSLTVSGQAHAQLRRARRALADGAANSTDISFPIGGGIGFSTGPNQTGAYLVLGLRYYAGLSNAYESNSGGDLSAKNQAIAPYFRANIPLG